MLRTYVERASTPDLQVAFTLEASVPVMYFSQQQLYAVSCTLHKKGHRVRKPNSNVYIQKRERVLGLVLTWRVSLQAWLITFLAQSACKAAILGLFSRRSRANGTEGIEGTSHK